jgi:hypothetical protein
MLHMFLQEITEVDISLSNTRYPNFHEWKLLSGERYTSKKCSFRRLVAE